MGKRGTKKTTVSAPANGKPRKKPKRRKAVAHG